MKHLLTLTILLTAFATLSWASPNGEPTAIGVVRNCEGGAAITHGDRTVAAAVGAKLFAGDALSTGADGTIGVILRDNSSISLGPGSNIVIQHFLFSPAEGRLGLIARLASGTMAYLSGLIGKLAPETVRFETPVASIGIRGTCFVVKAGGAIIP